MFESYHAMSNREQIVSMMRQYRVEEANPNGPTDAVVSDLGREMYAFQPDGFYLTTRARVREYFAKRAAAKAGIAPTDEAIAKLAKGSLTAHVKVTASWCIISALQLLAFAALYLTAFGVIAAPAPLAAALRCARLDAAGTVARAVCAALAGVVYIQIGFKTMHDASHFALAAKSPRLNEWPAMAWNAFMLWRYDMWQTHHVYRHHAFTGHPDLDPDLHHAKPFIQKHFELNPTHSGKYMKIPQQFVAAWTCLVVFLLPGQSVGQSLAYHTVWSRKGYLWKLGRPVGGVSGCELALMALSLGCHLFGRSFAVSWTYAVALNAMYALMILPDHDTIGTAQNHLDGTDGVSDWGEVQVRNSADFACGGMDAVCHLFGGINYQIEHHLFPSINHVHLPAVAPIVREVCREFGIKHVAYNDTLTAFQATIAQYRDVQRLKENVKAE
jgi:fatty acid desaturase